MTDEPQGTEVVRREDVEQSPQETQDRSQLPSGMLEPVVSPAEVVRSRGERSKMIAEALEEGRDYGSVEGIPKPFLHKPGAERLTDAFGCYPRFRIIDQEVDHDRRIEWEKRSGKSGTSRGLYRYVVSCDLIHRASGIVVGNGLGVCSSMEDKYVESPRNAENTIAKMAKKRAHVDAALSTFGLSEMFTQDEDYVRENGSNGSASRGGSSPATDKQLGFIRGLAKEKALDEDARNRLKKTLESGVSKAKASDIIEWLQKQPDLEPDAPEPGEPLSDKQVVEKARTQWISYWESVHGEGTTGERLAWEAQHLDPHLLEDEDTPNHSKLDEEDYGMLAERLADEQSQEELAV